MTDDAIALTIPHDKAYHGVARLVVGGLAARLDFSYEHLEDLELALDGLLGNEAYAAGEEVTVELVVHPGAVELAVGPLNGHELRSALELKGEGIGLGRLLGAVVEGIALEERDGGEWLRLEKRVSRREVSAG